MSSPHNVQLTMVNIEGNHHQEVSQVEAAMYRKKDAVYYRYKEPDPAMGSTTTTIKVKKDELKIFRQGEVQSEQTFRARQTDVGFYHIAEGKLPLQTMTNEIDIQLEKGLGFIVWRYDLYISGDFSGSHHIKLHIQEAMG